MSSKKVASIIFIIIFLILVVTIYFVGGFYKSSQEREVERIVDETIKLKQELHEQQGRGVLLVEQMNQGGFSQVQTTFAVLEKPGFVVVTGERNPDVVIERDEFESVDIDWGATPLLEAGEYDGLVVKQNLEQTEIDRSVLRYSVWRDNGDGVFDQETDTFVRKHNYMLSGTKNEDGNVSVPYVKIEEPSFLLISGTYKEALINKSKIDALNVVGVSQYLKTDVYNDMNIPINLDASSTTYSYDVDVSIWIDNGDKVFDKYTDSRLDNIIQKVRLLRDQ